MSHPIPTKEYTEQELGMNRYQFKDTSKEHLHTLDGKPLIGTSSVVGVIAKPLTWWASGMALESLGWTNPRKVAREEGVKIAGKARKYFFISNEEYYDWLQECYRAHNTKKEKAADEGTDMHAELEGYVKTCLKAQGKPLQVADDALQQIKDFSNWAIENVEIFLDSEVHLYSEILWTGGITDCIAKMKDGKVAIIDFKSSKEAYESQFIQIAGYDIQLRENGRFRADGNIAGTSLEAEEYIVIPFGAEKFEPVYRYNTEQLREAFISALKIYKLINHI